MTGTEYSGTLAYVPRSVHHHHHHHIHYNDDSHHKNDTHKPRQQQYQNHQQHNYQHHHHHNHNYDQTRHHIKQDHTHLDVKKHYLHMGNESPIPCKVCGKLYRHISMLNKHLWEHTPGWLMTQDMSISKQQQVQLLEAATILVDMMRANHRIPGHPLSPSPTPSPSLTPSPTPQIASASPLGTMTLSPRSNKRPLEVVSPPSVRKVKKDVRFRNRRLSSSAAYRKKERKLPTISEEGAVVHDSPLEEE